MSAPANRRMQTDVMKLCMSDSNFDVELVNDSLYEFYVRFRGPEETPFAGGVWRVHVELPEQYPYKSPSIGFINKIFHPNIDELSGSVCLDVINQTWSPMFDMVNIFEQFLPQLLRYPNPADPLNGEAANLLMREPKQYEEKVKQYVNRFATAAQADAAKGITPGQRTGGAPATTTEPTPAADGMEEDEEEDDAEISDAGSIDDD
ncbi:hypothetical protein DL93DRAFT_2232537 [Clavulina sp. PMI_390]|nr:hypothetical protein DL93DRAFT_2232537 [Clavulina sp. PMI_390]